MDQNVSSFLVGLLSLSLCGTITRTGGVSLPLGSVQALWAHAALLLGQHWASLWVCGFPCFFFFGSGDQGSNSVSLHAGQVIYHRTTSPTLIIFNTSHAREPFLCLWPEVSSLPLPAYHLVAGSGALTLELCKLSAVMNGNKQLPDGQECKPNQEGAAHHSQQNGHGVGGGSTF